MSTIKTDGLVKSLQGRHSREACPRPDRGAGISAAVGLSFLSPLFEETASIFFLSYPSLLQELQSVYASHLPDLSGASTLPLLITG